MIALIVDFGTSFSALISRALYPFACSAKMTAIVRSECSCREVLGLEGIFLRREERKVKNWVD